MTLGTPLYMSPEQGEGRTVDARSDLYSLGATVYHLLAGRPPYSGPSAVAVVMAHIKEPLVPVAAARPDLPAGLCEIVDRLLAKDPGQRFESPQSLLQAVDDLESAMFSGSRALPPPLAWPEGAASWMGAAAMSSMPMPTRPLPGRGTNPRLRDATVHLKAAVDRAREEQLAARRRWTATLGAALVALAVGFAVGRLRPRRSSLFGPRR
jgi:serine/threonine-protein kinase